MFKLQRLLGRKLRGSELSNPTQTNGITQNWHVDQKRFFHVYYMKVKV